MILALSLWGSVLFRGELWKYAKKSISENFESALYSTLACNLDSHKTLVYHHVKCFITHWATCVFSTKSHCQRLRKHVKPSLTYGSTPLNNPPIDMQIPWCLHWYFSLILTHMTIFLIFWLHGCLNWRLEFSSKCFFDANLGKFSEGRVIEQRQHEFQLTHMPPHQLWPWYYTDGLVTCAYSFWNIF